MLPTFKSQGVDVPYELLQPAGEGPYPAIVMVHGTEGMRESFGSAIRDYGEELKKTGKCCAHPILFWINLAGHGRAREF